MTYSARYKKCSQTRRDGSCPCEAPGRRKVRLNSAATPERRLMALAAAVSLSFLSPHLSCPGCPSSRFLLGPTSHERGCGSRNALYRLPRVQVSNCVCTFIPSPFCYPSMATLTGSVPFSVDGKTALITGAGSGNAMLHDDMESLANHVQASITASRSFFSLKTATS